MRFVRVLAGRVMFPTPGGGGRVFGGRLAARRALFAAAPVGRGCRHGCRTPYGRVQTDGRGRGQTATGRSCGSGSRGGGHLGRGPQHARLVRLETRPGRGGGDGGRDRLVVMGDDGGRAAGR